jgi:UDP-N-acetylmuramate: L-alanyl-gamma-D-glutamyl-meso-diaminopimelate ligase
VRSFNRFYTQQIGVLEEGLLRTPYPLPEARVLWEMGRRGATTATELRRELDLDPGYLSRLLRRLERRGVVAGVTVIDDFAHHPTAILETVRAIKASYPDRRVWAVFEPRSATSCRRIFQQEFARAFAESGADEIVLAAVYRATLPDDERLSVDDLVRDLKRAGRRARHLPDADAIVHALASEVRDGDVVLLMSNGGFGGIHRKLLDALEATAHR